MEKVIICVMGPMGSGKATITDYLKEKEFVLFLLSQVVKEKTLEMGLPLIRENLQKIGEHLRRTYGNDYVAKTTVDRIRKDPHQRIIIDGPRNIAEVVYIRDQFPNALLLYIDADSDLRKERIIRRGRLDDPTALEQLDSVMERDLRTVEPCKHLKGVIVLYNNETLAKFQEQLTEILITRGII